MTLSPNASLRSFPLSGHPSLQAMTANPNRITDLTFCDRIGLRGAATPEWCRGNELPFPEEINGIATSGGFRVARLGRTELLVVAEPEVRLPDTARLLPANVYDGFREETWSWFRIEGPEAREAFGVLSTIDLRASRVPAGRVVQTRAGGLDCVLLVGEAGGVTTLDLFSDISSSDYLVDVFGERCPGFDLLRR